MIKLIEMGGNMKRNDLLLLILLFAAAAVLLSGCAASSVKTDAPPAIAAETSAVSANTLPANKEPAESGALPDETLPADVISFEISTDVEEDPAVEAPVELADIEYPLENTIDAYKSAVINKIMLDYLVYDINDDGYDELVVAYYTLSDKEVTWCNGIDIWNPNYPCAAGIALADSSQYLHHTLKINDDGKLEMCVYQPDAEWDVMRFEVRYEIIDGVRSVS